MNEREFQHLADAYGADLSRWPAAERQAALQLAETPWAAKILREARGLDQLFESLDTPVAPSRIGRSIGAVTAAIARPPLTLASLWQRFGLSGTGLVTAGLMGIVLAISTAAPSAPDQGAADLLALALTYSDSPLLTSSGDPA